MTPRRRQNAAWSAEDEERIVCKENVGDMVCRRFEFFPFFPEMPSMTGICSVQLKTPASSSYLIPFHHDLRLLGDGTTGLGTALAGVETGGLALDDVGTLLDDFLTLGQDELDVAGVGHVGVDLIISID